MTKGKYEPVCVKWRYLKLPFPYSLIKVLIPVLHVRSYLRQVLPIWLIIAYRCLKWVFTIIAAIALALLLVLTGFALYAGEI